MGEVLTVIFEDGHRRKGEETENTFRDIQNCRSHPSFRPLLPSSFSLSPSLSVCFLPLQRTPLLLLTTNLRTSCTVQKGDNVTGLKAKRTVAVTYSLPPRHFFLYTCLHPKLSHPPSYFFILSPPLFSLPS